jgi:Uma2 family endonuclease
MIVLLKSEKSLMTVGEFYEFVNQPENQARSFELVRGEVIEVSRPRRVHCCICANVTFRLESDTRKKRKGYVVCNDTGVVLEHDPDTVRGPDIAYFEDAERWEDLPEKWGVTVPRLIVEIISPNDGAQYINDKIGDYLRNGVEVIWVIDPDSKRINVYSKNEGVKTLTEKDTITGGKVLPGFRCKVTGFFVLPAGAKKPKRKRSS